MPYNRRQLFHHLDKLKADLGEYGFKKGTYVVLAGGAMLAHGTHLRKETKDIDVSVNPGVFKKLVDNKDAIGALHPPVGFQQHEKLIIPGPYGDVELSGGGMSLIGRPPVEIKGHHFQSLTDVLEFKRMLARQKDRLDIERLEKVLARLKRRDPKKEYQRHDITFIKRTTVRGGDAPEEDF
ncbi:MAG: hypothetical protein WCX64_05685 [Candidatus Micrarchaeia archaeon]|jgi:hypothetical protein